MKSSYLIPIIIIQGPTAVGKSQLAMQLAKDLQTELISADSRQIYKYMDIGTAKPSLQEQSEIPHHLLDIVTPDVRYNAGTFAKQATEISKQLRREGKIPIVVGGTGFYIKSMLTGLCETPIIPEEIKNELEIEYNIYGFSAMYEKIVNVDPASAKRIELNDKNRLLRAMEVYRATGKSITEHWKDQELIKLFFPYNILISEDRNRIYKWINERVLRMLENGLIMEFQLLLEKGYNKLSPGMNSVGYKELFAFMDGEKSLPDCVQDIQQHSRNYAKRQFTWYRKQEFDLTIQASDINFSKIQRKIANWIKNGVGSLL
jgi:tRNA dimethylallyltransferase